MLIFGQNSSILINTPVSPYPLPCHCEGFWKYCVQWPKSKSLAPYSIHVGQTLLSFPGLSSIHKSGLRPFIRSSAVHGKLIPMANLSRYIYDFRHVWAFGLSSWQLTNRLSGCSISLRTFLGRSQRYYPWIWKSAMCTYVYIYIYIERERERLHGKIACA